MSSLTNVQKALFGIVAGASGLATLMCARHSFLSIRAAQDSKHVATDQKTKAIAGNVLLGIANLLMTMGAGYATFLIGKTLRAGSLSLDAIYPPFQVAILLYFTGLCLGEVVERAIFKGTKLPSFWNYPLIPLRGVNS